MFFYYNIPRLAQQDMISKLREKKNTHSSLLVSLTWKNSKRTPLKKNIPHWVPQFFLKSFQLSKLKRYYLTTGVLKNTVDKKNLKAVSGQTIHESQFYQFLYVSSLLLHPLFDSSKSAYSNRTYSQLESSFQSSKLFSLSSKALILNNCTMSLMFPQCTRYPKELLYLTFWCH